MTQAEKFLADIEAFLDRSKMSATSFGKACLNDTNFVGDLRSGRQPSLGLVDRVNAFIQSQEASAA